MLIYTGGGFGGSLPNIPARDLTDDEAQRLGGADQLVATGLYSRPGVTQPASNPKAKMSGAIDLRDGVSVDEKTLAGKTLRAAQDKEKQP